MLQHHEQSARPWSFSSCCFTLSVVFLLSGSLWMQLHSSECFIGIGRCWDHHHHHRCNLFQWICLQNAAWTKNLLDQICIYEQVSLFWQVFLHCQASTMLHCHVSMYIPLLMVHPLWKSGSCHSQSPKPWHFLKSLAHCREYTWSFPLFSVSISYLSDRAQPRLSKTLLLLPLI